MKTVYPSLILFPTQRPRMFVSVLLALFVLLLIMVSPTLAAAQAVDDTATTPVGEATADAPVNEPELPPMVDAPDEVPPVFQPPDPNDVVTGFWSFLYAAFSTAIAFPLTATLASYVKRIPYFAELDEAGKPRLSGDQANLLVAMTLSLIMWTAASLGFASQVETAFKVIAAVLPILGGVGGNFVANKLAYSAARALKLPGIGYSRTKPTFMMVAAPQLDGRP
jgi:hypothetical protein